MFGLSCKYKSTSVAAPAILKNMKNFGQRERITLPKSFMSSFLNRVGAVIDVCKRITPTIIPGK